MSGIGDFTGVFIVLLFVVVAFITAMNKGVVKLLASGIAAALALAILYSGIYILPQLAKTYADIDLTWKMTVGIPAALALVVYVVSRLILGAMIKSAFNPDGWFHSLVDGIPGGILSFFPSAVVVFFLCNCIRVAGTLQELNYIDSLAQDGISEMGGRIPAYPFSSSWRNGIESIPMAAPALDLIDPFSNRANRNTAALVLAAKSKFLKPYLLTLPETAELVEMEQWEGLAAEPGIASAIRKFDRIALVVDPATKAAATDPAVSADLKKLILKPALKGFVASIKPKPPEPELVEPQL